QKNYILTYYTIEPTRYLKGNLGRAFEIAEPGGVIGNRALAVPGAPQFQVGEELVLFVWTSGTPKRHQAIGFDQGAFRIRRDPTSGTALLNHTQPLSGGGQ